VIITWGAALRAKHGHEVSGDLYVARTSGSGFFVASVIDGLGGGEEAARAARAAERVIADHLDLPLPDMMRRAHTALHATRGAVIGVLRLEPRSAAATYVGIGNIGTHVYSRRPIKPISKNGILGYRLPSLLELRYTYDPGDLFVLYSDGVSGQFAHDMQIDLAQPPQALADQILHSYGKQSDDATVVVIKTVSPA